jgi:opacity protein-like surface antigen
MRRVPVFLSIAALVSAGCATNVAAIKALPEFSVTGLSSPDEATGWSEIELDVTAPRTQDPSYAPVTASDVMHHFTLMVGERELDEDDWGSFDSPTVYGVEVDQTSPSSGNGVEAGFFYTNDENDDFGGGLADKVEFTTYEFYGGVRHLFFPGPGGLGLHPFVSAGVEVLHGRIKLKAPGVSEADGELVGGAYARAGLLWDITDRLRLGADYRYLYAQNFDIFDTHLDPNYGQVVFSLGFAF